MPHAAPVLPTDLTHRPLRHDDARAVFEVMAAQELHDIGSVEIEEADIVGDWQRPSFDIASSTIGVFAGDRLVGYAEVGNAGRGDAAVHPDHRGRGIGTWLAEWTQRTARAQGQAEFGMPVPQGSDADRLLESLGYRVRWTSWVLGLPGDATIVDRPLPPGFAIRAARPEEYPAVHAVVEDAFLEWSERERETFEDFRAVALERPGFEPWNVRVVVDTDAAEGDVVVGVGMVQLAGDDGEEAYISRLAVRRDLRGRGLAQSLMVDAFALAREHGARTSALSTDSRTGALGLYEKVGMVVTSTWVNRGIALT